MYATCRKLKIRKSRSFNTPAVYSDGPHGTNGLHAVKLSSNIFESSWLVVMVPFSKHALNLSTPRLCACGDGCEQCQFCVSSQHACPVIPALLCRAKCNAPESIMQYTVHWEAHVLFNTRDSSVLNRIAKNQKMHACAHILSVLLRTGTCLGICSWANVHAPTIVTAHKKSMLQLSK